MSGVTFSPGDSIVAYIDGETQNGATVTKDPISNVNNLHIYENRVIVRHEGTDPLTIADMSVWDSSLLERVSGMRAEHSLITPHWCA